jgi:hypothetical protein
MVHLVILAVPVLIPIASVARLTLGPVASLAPDFRGPLLLKERNIRKETNGGGTRSFSATTPLIYPPGIA